MNETNTRITKVVGQILRNEGRLKYQDTPGFCLAITRQIIERALLINLYRDYVVSWVQPESYNKLNGHWARDFERDAKIHGWSIPARERRHGDIVFNYASAWSSRYNAFIGHVGILWYDDMIFENINPKFRKLSFMRGALSLTPFGDWPVTLIARIPDSVLKEAK